MTLENDFNTLIGEMEDNLQAMGVLDAEFDPTTGLRGLTARILDIEPSIGGLDLDTAVNITANPSTIIVGQSIILTSKLTATYDDETIVDVDLTGVLTGATIQYKEGNTVLGTAVTDNNGIATCTVSGLTLGTHTVKAVFQGTENFNDCESSNITITVNNPEPASLTLAKTGGKQILSYVDRLGGGEFCELTCTVLDAGGNPLPSIPIDVYKNNVFWHTIESDDAGEITILYDSEGAGDVLFKAVCGSLVTETFAIQDCRIYDDTLTDNLSKYTSNGTTYNSSEKAYYLTGNGAYLNRESFVADFEWEATMDFKFNGAVSSTNFYYGITNNTVGDNNYDAQGWVFGSSPTYGMGVWYKKNTSSHTQQNKYQSYSLNTWYTLKVVLKDNVLTVTVLNGSTVVNTVTLSADTTTANASLRAFCDMANIYLKNLKLKPL